MGEIKKLNFYAFAFLFVYLIIVGIHYFTNSVSLNLNQLIVILVSIVILFLSQILLKKRRIINLFIIFYMVVASLISIYGFFHSGSIFSYGPDLGKLLSLVVPIPLFLFFLKDKLKWFYLFSFIILLAGVFASGSRGAFISIISSILLISFIEKKKLKIKRKHIIYSILIIIIFFLIFSGFSFKLLSTFKGNILSDRPEIWLNSFKLIRQKVLFGNGVSLYSYDIYLQILLEAGLVVFVLFLFFLYNLFKISLNKLSKLKRYNYFLLIGLLSGTLSFLILGLIEHSLSGKYFALLFWLNIGLIINLLKNEK